MQKKIIKITIWSIIWIVIAFIGWQALLIANVYMAKKSARLMIGHEYYMHDYYYADISNITYTGHNFLLYVQKPLLFSPKHFYLYSSKDGVTWKREFTSLFGGLDGDVQDQRFGKQQIFDESGMLYGFISNAKLDGYWRYPKNFPVHNYQGCSIPYEHNSDNGVLIYSENCTTRWLTKSIKIQRFTTVYQESYPEANIKSFMILKNIIRENKLNIRLGIPHAANGNGKYIGIFSKMNKYYLIISSDGVHYKIKELPSNVTSSLAISVFGN